VKFSTVALDEAEGCVLAHSVRLREGVLRKGMVLGETELQRLSAAGVGKVVVARLGARDVPEDEAAARIAARLAGEGVERGNASTGRVNLHAAGDGLLRLDEDRIESANRIHEALTIATLPGDSPVSRGQLLATIKIIPYAAPRAALDKMLLLLARPQPTLSVCAWRGLRVGLVITETREQRDSVTTKMRQSVVQRLLPLNAQLAAEAHIPHDETALAGTLAALMREHGKNLDLLLISGAAATVDRADVVPAAIERARGKVLHLGMPVDPGNLLLLARLPVGRGSCPVVGIPTCARSPKLNGFDFVLRRFAAGLPVTGALIMGMGVGGLLTEIENRPMPRDEGR